MKKIIGRINKATGQMTLSTEGFTGEACLEATRKLREGLGIEAEPELTKDYYVEEASENQQTAGS